ncbi:MAG: acyl-CoA dehydrogenase family protein [Thermodesulfobacteriota bacterium]
MDFALSPAEEAFRRRVRDWLRANLPEGWGTPRCPRPRTPAEKVAFARRWQRTLYDGGWAGVSWPAEYGGQALSPLEQLMFHEECFAAGAPDMIDIAIGLNLTGPTPGITVRPLAEMTGVAWFNEVFFDNVVVPLDMVVGEIDRGWDIAITTLSHERGTVVPYQRLAQHLDGVAALARRLAADAPRGTGAADRQRLAQLAIDVAVLRLSTYRNLSQIMRSGRPGAEGSMLKLLWSELEQRIMEAAASISGAYAQLDEHAPQAVDAGRWQYGYLWSRAATIYAGTSEVQRNIIAQRMLGLPR